MPLKMHFVGPIGTKKRAKIPYMVFQKRLDFFASQRMVFSVFFEALYLGHFLLFHTMQPEPPKLVFLMFHFAPYHTYSRLRNLTLSARDVSLPLGRG